MTTKEEFQLICERQICGVVSDLESLAAGDLERCPDCGSVMSHWDFIAPGYDEQPNPVFEITEEELREIEETFDLRCPICRNNLMQDDIEEYTVSDYVADALDVRIIVSWHDLVGNRKQVKGAQLQLCAGGPSVWVETDERKAVISWGDVRIEKSFPYKAAVLIDDYLESMLQDCWI